MATAWPESKAPAVSTPREPPVQILALHSKYRSASYQAKRSFEVSELFHPPERSFLKQTVLMI